MKPTQRYRVYVETHVIQGYTIDVEASSEQAAWDAVDATKAAIVLQGTVQGKETKYTTVLGVLLLA